MEKDEKRGLIEVLQERLEKAAKEGDRVVVFMSLHGLSRSTDRGGLSLLTIRTSRDLTQGDSQPALPVPAAFTIPELLEAINQSKIVDIMLCLDVGGLWPDASAGVLGSDEAQLVEGEIQRWLDDQRYRRDLRLTVLSSRGSGQVNWPLHDRVSEEQVPSIFGRTLADAFEGKADGSDRQEPDGRLTSQEIASYVQEQVNLWSSEQRGVQQSVGKFETLNMPTVPWLAVSKDEFDNGQKARIAQSAEPASPAPDAPTKKPSDSGGSTGPVTQAPPTGTQAPATSPPAAPATSETATADSPTGKTLLDLGQQSQAYWTELEKLQERLMLYAPHEYRSLRQDLTSAEVAWVYGLTGPMQHHLKRFRESFESVKQRLKPQQDEELSALSLSLAAGARLANKAEEKSFRVLFNDLAKPPPAEGQAALPAKGTELPPAIDTAEKRAVFCIWLVEQAGKNPPPLEVLGNVLYQLDQAGYSKNQWPAELHFLSAMVGRLKNETLSEAWKTDLQLRLQIALLSQQLDKLEFEQHRDAALEKLNDVVYFMVASERWLMAPGNHDTDAQKWLKKASDSLQQFQNLVDILVRGRRTLNASLLDFQDHAAWVAWNAENAQGERLLETLGEFCQELNGQFDEKFEEQVLARWPVAGDSNQEDLERGLFRHWCAVIRLRNRLEDATTLSDMGSLDETVKAAEKSLEDLNRLLVASVARLELESRGPQGWVLLERSAEMSWIPIERRMELRKAFSQTPDSDTAQARVFGDEQGLWMAFWGEMALQLLQDPDLSENRWEDWKALAEGFLKSSDDPGKSDLLDRRVRFGVQLADRWSKTQENYKKRVSNAVQNRYEFRPLLESDEELALARRLPSDSRKEAANLMAVWWLDQLPPTSSVFRAEVRQAKLRTTFPFGEPRFGDVAADEYRPNQLTVVKYELKEPQPGETAPELIKKAKVQVRAEHVSWDESQSESIPNSQGEGQFRIQVDPDLTEVSRGCVALMGEDDFPFDIRAIQFTPAVDPKKFAIEFRTSGSHQKVVRQKNGDNYLLMMAPQHQFRIEPVLVVPHLNKPTQVTVKVEYADELNRWKPMCPPLTREFPADGDMSDQPKPPVPLQFVPEGGENAKGSIDISEGVRFTIEVDGKTAESQTMTYIPEFWRYTQFIENDPIPEFNQGTYQVDVNVQTKSPTGDLDRLMPEKIPLELRHNCPPEFLKKNASEKDLRALLTLGGDEKLTLPLVGAVVPRFEFTLGVAGWRHALRYEYQDGQIRPVTQDVMTRILGVPSAPVWTGEGKPLDPLQLTVELDASVLDQPSQRVSAKLWLGVRGPGQKQDDLMDEISITRSQIRKVTLTLDKDHQWNVTTTVNDYTFTVDNLVDYAPGKNEFVSKLLLSSDSAGERSGESRSEIVLDDSLPVFDFQLQPSKVFEGDVVSGTVTIRDPDSGISRYEVWFDSDGDETRKKTELLQEQKFEPPLQDQGVRKYSFKFNPQEKGAKEPKEYLLMAKATNGAGQEESASHTVQIQPRPMVAGGKGNTEMPELGKLTVSFEASSWTGTLTLSGENLKVPLSYVRDEGDAEFSNLRPGKYTLTANRGTGGQHTATVTVSPGEATAYEVPSK